MKCTNCPFTIACYSDQFAKGTYLVEGAQFNIFWCAECGLIAMKGHGPTEHYFIFDCQRRSNAKIMELLHARLGHTTNSPEKLKMHGSIEIPDPAFNGRGDGLLLTGACFMCRGGYSSVIRATYLDEGKEVILRPHQLCYSEE